MITNPSPDPGSNEPKQESSPTPSPREERRAAREQRRANRGGAWVGGVVLILLGIVFLLQNMGMPVFENWWALFILIPAVGAFSTAWTAYTRNDGQITGAVIGSLVTGIILTGLVFTFLFNFDLSRVGPIALILLGIGALASAVLKPTK
jgi:hypothetical protein